MTKPQKSNVHEVANGEIVVWQETGGPIMLQSTNRHGDPVELAGHEARELAALLARLADVTDDS